MPEENERKSQQEIMITGTTGRIICNGNEQKTIEGSKCVQEGPNEASESTVPPATDPESTTTTTTSFWYNCDDDDDEDVQETLETTAATTTAIQDDDDVIVRMDTKLVSVAAPPGVDVDTQEDEEPEEYKLDDDKLLLETDVSSSVEFNALSEQSSFLLMQTKKTEKKDSTPKKSGKIAAAKLNTQTEKVENDKPTEPIFPKLASLKKIKKSSSTSTSTTSARKVVKISNSNCGRASNCPDKRVPSLSLSSSGRFSQGHYPNYSTRTVSSTFDTDSDYVQLPLPFLLRKIDDGFDDCVSDDDNEGQVDLENVQNDNERSDFCAKNVKNGDESVNVLNNFNVPLPPPPQPVALHFYANHPQLDASKLQAISVFSDNLHPPPDFLETVNHDTPPPPPPPCKSYRNCYGKKVILKQNIQSKSSAPAPVSVLPTASSNSKPISKQSSSRKLHNLFMPSFLFSSSSSKNTNSLKKSDKQPKQLKMKEKSKSTNGLDLLGMNGLNPSNKSLLLSTPQHAHPSRTLFCESKKSKMKKMKKGQNSCEMDVVDSSSFLDNNSRPQAISARFISLRPDEHILVQTAYATEVKHYPMVLSGGGNAPCGPGVGLAAVPTTAPSATHTLPGKLSGEVDNQVPVTTTTSTTLGHPQPNRKFKTRNHHQRLKTMETGPPPLSLLRPNNHKCQNLMMSLSLDNIYDTVAGETPTTEDMMLCNGLSNMFIQKPMMNGVLLDRHLNQNQHLPTPPPLPKPNELISSNMNLKHQSCMATSDYSLVIRPNNYIDVHASSTSISNGNMHSDVAGSVAATSAPSKSVTKQNTKKSHHLIKLKSSSKNSLFSKSGKLKHGPPPLPPLPVPPSGAPQISNLNSSNLNFLQNLQNLKPLSRAPIVLPNNNNGNNSCHNNTTNSAPGSTYGYYGVLPTAQAQSTSSTQPRQQQHHITNYNNVRSEGSVSLLYAPLSTLTSPPGSHRSLPVTVQVPSWTLMHGQQQQQRQLLQGHPSSTLGGQGRSIPPPPLKWNQYKAQLYSDLDYVIFPPKDPRLSQQEYFDSKSLENLNGGQVVAPPPPPPPPPAYLPPPPPYPLSASADELTGIDDLRRYFPAKSTVTKDHPPPPPPRPRKTGISTAVDSCSSSRVKAPLAPPPPLPARPHHPNLNLATSYQMNGNGGYLKQKHLVSSAPPTIYESVTSAALSDSNYSFPYNVNSSNSCYGYYTLNVNHQPTTGHPVQNPQPPPKLVTHHQDTHPGTYYYQTASGSSQIPPVMIPHPGITHPVVSTSLINPNGFMNSNLYGDVDDWTGIKPSCLNTNKPPPPPPPPSYYDMVEMTATSNFNMSDVPSSFYGTSVSEQAQQVPPPPPYVDKTHRQHVSTSKSKSNKPVSSLSTSSSSSSSSCSGVIGPSTTNGTREETGGMLNYGINSCSLSRSRSRSTSPALSSSNCSSSLDLESLRAKLQVSSTNNNINHKLVTNNTKFSTASPGKILNGPVNTASSGTSTSSSPSSKASQTKTSQQVDLPLLRALLIHHQQQQKQQFNNSFNNNVV